MYTFGSVFTNSLNIAQIKLGRQFQCLQLLSIFLVYFWILFVFLGLCRHLKDLAEEIAADIRDHLLNSVRMLYVMIVG